MKQNSLTIFLICFTYPLFSQWQPQVWPVLKHYDKDHLYNIALPVGGIGTGTVSVGGRGELRDWEIMNKPAKGFSTVTDGNNAPFFAIYVKPQTGKATTKALIGPLDLLEYLHYEGRPVNHHGLPRFSSASFDAAYPFGQVNLSDDQMPLKVKLKTFNPFIPGDADASGIPVAILAYEVTNTGAESIQVSVAGSIRNFAGKMASWPKGRLKVPFPYFSEAMTGFEYTAAVGMLYEGQTDNALKCLTSIRNRFDGRKRNPFSEPECGHHYARSMTSWNTILAWSGFQYSGVNKSMSFTAKPGTYFWSNGAAWGTCKIEANQAILTVLHGKLVLSTFSIQGKAGKKLKNFTLQEGNSKTINL